MWTSCDRCRERPNVLRLPQKRPRAHRLSPFPMATLLPSLSLTATTSLTHCSVLPSPHHQLSQYCRLSKTFLQNDQDVNYLSHASQLTCFHPLLVTVGEYPHSFSSCPLVWEGNLLFFSECASSYAANIRWLEIWNEHIGKVAQPILLQTIRRPNIPRI